MEPKQISDQIHRSVHGEAWHGSALLELLSGVDAAVAAAKPIPGSHSIWEIVLHVTAWQRAALEGLDGTPVDITGEADWPPVNDTSAAAWVETVDALTQTEALLSARVAALTEDALTKSITGWQGRRYPVHFLLNGIPQHNAYHGGQIALLKKAAGTR